MRGVKSAKGVYKGLSQCSGREIGKGIIKLGLTLAVGAGFAFMAATYRPHCTLDNVITKFVDNKHFVQRSQGKDSAETERINGLVVSEEQPVDTGHQDASTIDGYVSPLQKLRDVRSQEIDNAMGFVDKYVKAYDFGQGIEDIVYGILLEESKLKHTSVADLDMESLQLVSGDITSSDVSGVYGIGQLRVSKNAGVDDCALLLKKKKGSHPDKYGHIPYPNKELLIQPTKKGMQENIRTSVLYISLLMNKYDKHEGLVEAVYNWGNQNKIVGLDKEFSGKMQDLKKHFPNETLDYVNGIWKNKVRIREEGTSWIKSQLMAEYDDQVIRPAVFRLFSTAEQLIYSQKDFSRSLPFAEAVVDYYKNNKDIPRDEYFSGAQFLFGRCLAIKGDYKSALEQVRESQSSPIHPIVKRDGDYIKGIIQEKISKSYSAHAR